MSTQSNRKEPLGLPPGSVRSILALGIVGGAVVASFTNPETAKALLPMAGVVATAYFQTRKSEGE